MFKRTKWRKIFEGDRPNYKEWHPMKIIHFFKGYRPNYNDRKENNHSSLVREIFNARENLKMFKA